MSLSAVENLVAKLAGTDRFHTKKRFDLCLDLQVDDRELRQIKEDAVKQGFPVCSTSRAAGYWLGDEKDRAQLISEHWSRIYSHLGTIQALKGIPAEEQMTMTELFEKLGESKGE